MTMIEGDVGGRLGRRKGGLKAGENTCKGEKFAENQKQEEEWKEREDEK